MHAATILLTAAPAIALAAADTPSPEPAPKAAAYIPLTAEQVARCREQGGCIVVGRAVVEALREQARREGLQSCRNST